MKVQLNAAVIGLGVGQRHISGYESDSRCRVRTICDINKNVLEGVQKKYPHCNITTDANLIFEDPEIDVVSIASYDNDHAEYVLKAIKAGKHIFVEKPICLTEKEYESIHFALKEAQVQLSSNFVLRKSPQFQLVKERITSGVMGELFYLEGDYNYGRLHKLTTSWRGEIPFYSVTHGGAIHLIDLLIWLSGGTVTEVIATGNKIASKGTQFRHMDMVTALLKFEEGFTAKVSANFGSVCPHHHCLSVFGTQASFTHNYQGGVFYDSCDPDAIFEKMNLKYENISKTNVQRTFVCQILDGTTPEVTSSDVMKTMAVSLAIERSLSSNVWERVKYLE